MVADKPLKISDKTKQELDKLKKYPRETYDDIISRLIKPKGEQAINNKLLRETGGDD